MARVSKFFTAMQIFYSKYLSSARSFTVVAQERILPVKSCATSPKVAWKKTGQLQRTISRGFSKAGVGLHSGDEAVVRVLPAMAGEGRYFIIDKNMVRVPASTMNLTDTTLSVHVGKGGTSVRTIEHLLSALEGMGIDNCCIEIEGGNEVPLLDGSALEWVEAIEEAGTCIAKNNFGMDVEKMAPVVCEPFHVIKGESFVAVYPAPSTRITYGIDFQQVPAIGCQWFSWSPVDSMTYKEKVAPSRTFCVYEQIEQLRTAGLIKGGSLDNALVCRFIIQTRRMAASVSSTDNSRFKIDRRSPLWKYVEMVNQLPSGGGYLWICSHCKEEFSSSYSRVKAHLCLIPQQGIKFCTGKPRVNGVLPKTFLPNHIVNKYIQEQKQADEESGRASSHPLQNARKKAKATSMSSTSTDHSQ